MFEEIRYVPYQTTKFSLTPTGVTVQAPWLALDIDVTNERRSAVAAILQRLESGTVLDDAEIQEFLGFFATYPLLHVRPRRPQGGREPYCSEATELMNAAGPRQFLASINPFSDVSVDSAFDYFPDAWTWDAAGVAAESAIPDSDLFDPYSVYTSIRRRRLSFQIEHATEAHRLLEELSVLKRQAEPKFFEAMATILAQQYYVTRECAACLNPALESHGLIREQIAAYMREELNHDRLILRSIRELSMLPTDQFYFAPEVRLEIEVIKYAARTCALGFSALVSIMEGTVYPEADPVGEILRDSTRPAAQAGVESHFQINRRGNHTAIPEKFVHQMPPVTRQTVEVATRLAEVTIRLDTGLARSLRASLTTEIVRAMEAGGNIAMA